MVKPHPSIYCFLKHRQSKAKARSERDALLAVRRKGVVARKLKIVKLQEVNLTVIQFERG